MIKEPLPNGWLILGQTIPFLRTDMVDCDVHFGHTVPYSGRSPSRSLIIHAYTTLNGMHKWMGLEIVVASANTWHRAIVSGGDRSLLLIPPPKSSSSNSSSNSNSITESFLI